MAAYADPPPEARAPATRPASRWETLVLLVKLAGDLLSVPFHLALFVVRREGHRRRFRRSLEESTR